MYKTKPFNGTTLFPFILPWHIVTWLNCRLSLRIGKRTSLLGSALRLNFPLPREKSKNLSLHQSYPKAPFLSAAWESSFYPVVTLEPVVLSITSIGNLLSPHFFRLMPATHTFQASRVGCNGCPLKKKSNLTSAE